MRSVSSKRRKREKEARPFREALIQRVGECECCGCSPTNRMGKMASQARLCVHEIANGPNRQKALDKPYAVLVACWQCNAGKLDAKGECPEAAQLAMLLISRPEDFDLKAYLELTSPNAPRRIELHQVQSYVCDEPEIPWV